MGAYGRGYKDTFWSILSGENVPGVGEKMVESVMECRDGK